MALPGSDRTRAYHVYVRHDKEPQLHHNGEVRAAGPADAVIFAHTLYDERRWREMFVVPASDVITLIAPE